MERDVEELGWGFSMLEAFRNDPEGQSLDARDRFIPVGAVAHHSSERWNLGEPAAIVLSSSSIKKVTLVMYHPGSMERKVYRAGRGNL